MMRTPPAREDAERRESGGELAGEQLLPDEHHHPEDQRGLDDVARHPTEEGAGRAGARQVRPRGEDPVDERTLFAQHRDLAEGVEHIADRVGGLDGAAGGALSLPASASVR